MWYWKPLSSSELSSLRDSELNMEDWYCKSFPTRWLWKNHFVTAARTLRTDSSFTPALLGDNHKSVSVKKDCMQNFSRNSPKLWLPGVINFNLCVLNSSRAKRSSDTNSSLNWISATWAWICRSHKEKIKLTTTFSLVHQIWFWLKLSKLWISTKG